MQQLAGKRAPRCQGRTSQSARRVGSVGRGACGSSVSIVRTLLSEERSQGTATRVVYGDIAALPEPEWVNNQLTWKRPQGLPVVDAPADAPPIVILPGFGNATTDYTAPFGSQDAGIATRLQARGWRVSVVPVERKNWFNVARGLLTRGFWSSSLTTHPGYTWYLERVAETVEKTLRETGAEQVVLVGHSAGGWLGRAYLADPRYHPEAGQDSATPRPQPGTAGAAPNPRVRAIVTLGTPQRPPPPEKKRDMTGGAQGWVDRTYPGAHFLEHPGGGVRYVTVCGRTVRGHREFPRQREGPRIPEEYAYDSYTEVSGEGEGLAGDCVVPLSSALLPGARHVVLDGVFHSMSRIGTFEEESGVVWYGSEDVLDAWLGPLVEELGEQDRRVAVAGGEEAAAGQA